MSPISTESFPPDPDTVLEVADPASALIDDWLLAFEDALARGAEPPEPPEEIRGHPRLLEARACIERLEEALRPTTTVVVDWQDPSLRELAAGRTPETVGRFEIVREIGRGGCGLVFLAFDPALGREVALKVPRPEMLLSAEMRQRFLREAQAAAGLNHSGIVTIHEISEAGSLPYIAAAYCPGPPLSRWLVGRSNVRVEAAARLVMRVADAVQHAHDRGIFHRDIKPSNILLQPLGEVHSADLDVFTPLITDFGLAKIRELTSSATRTGQVLGTPTYMPPEQAQGRGEEIVPASDVYGLGAVLYELLTGQPPFSGGTDVDVLRQVIHDDPPLPRHLRTGLPADLEAICLRCLEKTPARRYATARELADDLARFLNGRPTVARPLGRLRRSVKWARRHRALSALIVLGTLTVIGGFTAFTIYSAKLEEVVKSLAQTNDQLIERGRQLELKSYADNIRLAARLLEANELREVRNILDDLRPKEGADDLRDFAWRHLHQEVHADRLTLRGHSSEVYHLAYSPDRTALAASGKDGTIRLWSLTTGEEIAVLRGHESEVNGILFTPDGRQLVSASDDKTVRFWDLETRQCLRILRGHDDHVYELGWLGDGRTLVSAGRDKTVRYWVPEWDHPADTLKLPTDSTCGVLHPQSGWVVAALEDGRVQWWDLKTRQMRHEGRAPRSAKRLAFLADGLGVAMTTWLGDFFTVQPDAEARSILEPEDRLSVFRASPDGRHLLIGSSDGRIIVGDLASGRTRTVLHAHDSRVWDIEFAPDGTGFTSCSMDGTVKLWDWSRVLRREPVRFAGNARSATFIPGRPWLGVAGFEDTVQCWDYENDAPVFGPGTPGDYLAIAYSPRDGQLFASDERDSHVGGFRVPPVPNREIAPSEGILIGSAGTWARPGIVLAGYRQLKGANGVVMAISRDGGTLAVGTGAGDVILTDEPAGTAGPIFSTPEETVQKALALHPTLPILACRGLRGEILMWDWSKRQLVQKLDGHRLDVTALTFSPNGSLLASGSQDGVILLWDWKTGAVVRHLPGHLATVWSLAFTPSGKGLASGSEDHTVRLWQVQTGNELLNFSEAGRDVRWVGFNEEGTILAVLADDKRARRTWLTFHRAD